MELKEVLLLLVTITVAVQFIIGAGVLENVSTRLNSLEATQGLAVTVCNFDQNSNSVLINPNTGQPDCYRLNWVLEAQQERLNTLEQNQVAIIQELQNNTLEARGE